MQKRPMITSAFADPKTKKLAEALAARLGVAPTRLLEKLLLSRTAAELEAFALRKEHNQDLNGPADQVADLMAEKLQPLLLSSLLPIIKSAVVDSASAAVKNEFDKLVKGQ